MSYPKSWCYLIVLSMWLSFLAGCGPHLTATPLPPPATVVPATTVPAATQSQLMENTTGKTLISCANKDTQFRTSAMLISQGGTVVVVDPYLVLKGITADVIAITHGDFDHNDDRFVGVSNARKSLYTVETFAVKDVTVTSLASSHSGNDIDPAAPTNVIYLFEMDGLRIAHLGDIAQDRLTDEQLAALGQLDVVFLPLMDAPEYGFTIEKSMAILEQLQPRVILPTHRTPDGLEALKQYVDETIEAPSRWAVSAADLQDGKHRAVLLTP